MEEEKNSKYSSLLGAIVIIVLTINAAYAYFTADVQIDNGALLNVTAPEAPTFVAYAVDKLELRVSAENLIEASTLPSASDVAELKATLSSADGQTVSCKYDIVMVWDSATQYVNPTTTLSGDYKYEISLKGLQTITNDTTGHSYGVTNLSETNLTAFTWSGNAGTIGRAATLIKGAEIYSNSTTPTEAKWQFTINFYTLPTDQSALLGQNYNAHLAVTNVVC